MWTFTGADGHDRLLARADAARPVPVQTGDFTIDADTHVIETSTYVTDPDAHHIVKVSQGGSGLCEGELDLFSDDGKTCGCSSRSSTPTTASPATASTSAAIRDDQWKSPLWG